MEYLVKMEKTTQAAKVSAPTGKIAAKKGFEAISTLEGVINWAAFAESLPNGWSAYDVAWRSYGSETVIQVFVKEMSE